MKLTVLIPIYNTRPDHLTEAVYSVLKQDDGIEHDILLIDDGSIDEDTIACVELLAEMHYDRVKAVFADKNGGTSSALNLGHSLVKTKYVALMGSQDISAPSRFRKQIAYLKENPEVDVLGTNLFSFYDGDIRRSSIWSSKHPEVPDITNKFVVNHGTVIYKNQAVLDAGGYDLNFRRGQDVDLWGRMIKAGYIFRNITETLYAWRKFK